MKAKFRIIPRTNWIVGRMVDIDMSQGGIELVTSDVKNLTVFLLVDDVGPEVKNAKVGEIIAYRTMLHVYTRDGQHVAVVPDVEANIIGVVADLDMAQVIVEGEKKDRQPIAVDPLNPS